MLGIKIRDTFLSLFEDTEIQFDEAHPIGLIADALDSLQGGYSFPVSIPLDDINRGVIGHIDRLDADHTLLVDEYCEIWVEGILHRIGTATIRQSSRTTGELYIILHAAAALEDTLLTELDLGGDRSIGGDEATRTAHADDTLANPLDHDYCFAPIYNPKYNPLWKEGFPTAQQALYQNFYDAADGGFQEYVVAAITPFVRLYYLLDRIFTDAGYSLANQWQTTDELKLLLIYNNYNINSHTAPAVSSWDTSINLINHVPQVSVLKLIKAIIGTFCQALFMDPVTRVAELIPWRTLITAAEYDDWTSRVAADYIYNTDRQKYIGQWRYDLDDNDDLSVRFSVFPFPQHIVQGEGLTCRAMDALGQYGIRYSLCDNTYYMIAIDIPGFQADYLAQDLKDVIKDTAAEQYISPLIPLWNSHDIETDGDVNEELPIQQQQLAAIEHLGYVKETPTYAGLPVTSMRLFFYRGFQPFDTGIDGTYPMTGITRYNITGDIIGEYALTLDRDEGIYNQWWKHAYEMLRTAKRVTRDMRLSIADLRTFHWKHKYRIENQNYFITRLQYSISMRGLGVVRAEMITAP